MSKGYKEDTRVQVPAVLHLTRLGYKYIGKGVSTHTDTNIFDQDTNILVNVFRSQYVDITEDEFNQRMTDYKQTLAEQFKESHRLEDEIMKQLNSLKFEK